MKLIKRSGLLISVVLVAMASALTGAGAATAQYLGFTAGGTVASAGSSSFVIGAPVNTYGGAVDQAENPDGSLTVNVGLQTTYYKFNSGTNSYEKGTYATTVVPGVPVVTQGKYAKIGSTYSVFADRVYQPAITATPPNPPCVTNQEKLNNRSFNVKGNVTANKYDIASLGIQEPLFGFIMNNASTTDSHTAAVLAHDGGNIGLNVIGEGQQDIAGHIPFTTRYLQYNSSSGNYEPVTKGDLMVYGLPLQTAGRYGCDLGTTNDWRFYTQFVWSPPLGSAGSGPLSWQEVAPRSADGTAGTGTQTGTAYSGAVVNGGGSDIAIGAPFTMSNADWSYNGVSQLWEFTADWSQATNANEDQTITGTLTGTWNAVSGNLSGTAILSGGTGTWASRTGVGSFSGTGKTGLGSSVQVPSSFDAKFSLQVT